ncbi:uncharacterized protein LOC127004578 [Eriocheir sinensis]|uniref:uncharacterized protein LOC127004578 n=1 Tax=Eriocheir sinensis TaxID=95602 RepID=UPI0021C9BE05|nr:uncharacterized protein LOC127004578 [Eriocheir sinensis]XP_050728417.1 uncharacterized protein LOC127004578 [Eriocheir sinensis]XP_050728418.1 uncharacterized protein LOC127004578 [Eriocheir sinensis]
MKRSLEQGGGEPPRQRVAQEQSGRGTAMRGDSSLQRSEESQENTSSGCTSHASSFSLETYSDSSCSSDASKTDVDVPLGLNVASQPPSSAAAPVTCTESVSPKAASHSREGTNKLTAAATATQDACDVTETAAVHTRGQQEASDSAAQKTVTTSPSGSRKTSEAIYAAPPRVSTVTSTSQESGLTSAQLTSDHATSQSDVSAAATTDTNANEYISATLETSPSTETFTQSTTSPVLATALTPSSSSSCTESAASSVSSSATSVTITTAPAVSATIQSVSTDFTKTTTSSGKGDMRLVCPTTTTVERLHSSDAVTQPQVSSLTTSLEQSEESTENGSSQDAVSNTESIALSSILLPASSSVPSPACSSSIAGGDATDSVSDLSTSAAVTCPPLASLSCTGPPLSGSTQASSCSGSRPSSVILSAASTSTSRASPSPAVPSSSLRPRALSSDSSSDSSTDSLGVVPAGEGSTHEPQFTSSVGLSTTSGSVFPSLLIESGVLSLQAEAPSPSSLLTAAMDSLPLDELVEMPHEAPESSHLSLSSPGLQLPNASETGEEVGYSDLNISQQDEGEGSENTAEESAEPLLTSAPLTTEDEAALDLCFLSRDEERKAKEKKILRSGKVPPAGSPVAKGQLRRAGPYVLGPRLGTSPVRSIVQCLARQENTENFYTLKILTVREMGEENQDDRQGKMLLHTEHSLLSLLSGQHGVIQHHGLFQDYAYGVREQGSTSSSISRGGGLVSTGNLVRRVCLVLDCVTPQDYCPHTADLINLQHYVITKKKLAERHALTIFYNIVSVVHSLHEQNVVHRDLKLGNLVLHRVTREIIITNFCLGQHLPSEKDRLRDQRGSPAYISPDVLSGKPYLGKPSDMWALGVVLFTMLYCRFPFYDVQPQELFRKIKAAQYTLPKGEKMVSEATKEVIRGLLVLDPNQRFTCKQVLTRLTAIVSGPIMDNLQLLQVVPEMEEFGEEPREREARKALPSKRSKLMVCDGVEQCFKNTSTLPTRQKSSVEPESDNPAKYNIDHLLMQLAKQKRTEESSHMVGSKTSSGSSGSSSGSSSSGGCSSGGSSGSSSSRSSGVIPCLVGDTRPLTAAELSSFRHILPHAPRLGEGVNHNSRPSAQPPPPPPPPSSSASQAPPAPPLPPPPPPPPPPNVAVVVTRSSSDRFSSLFPPQPTPITRAFSINILRSSPSSSRSQSPQNITSSLSPHMLSSHLPSSMPPHLSSSSPRLRPPSHSLSSSPLLSTYGVFPNPVQPPSSLARDQPPSLSRPRARWSSGVHSRIVHNISSLQHRPGSPPSTQEPRPPPSLSESGDTIHHPEEHPSNSIPSSSSSSSGLPSQLPRGSFRLVVRARRNRSGSLASPRPYHPAQHYR